MALPHLHDTAGTIVPLSKDRVTTVGREGDLAFPDNEHLHRRLLAVYWHDDAWWMENVGTWIPVRYGQRGVALSALLEVGRSVRVSGTITHVVFRAGRTEYEVVVSIPEITEPKSAIPTPVGVRTIGPDELNDEQVMMLVAFCESILLNPGVGIDQIKSMKQVQERLDWSGAKLRRKLDYLCEKLAEAGVGGLVSTGDTPATNRRIVICEWALSTRAINAAQLRLLH